MKKIVLIEGMKCDGCVSKVTERFKSIDGVTDVSVNLQDKSAVIESHCEVSDSAIQDSLANEKYKVVGITEA